MIFLPYVGTFGFISLFFQYLILLGLISLFLISLTGGLLPSFCYNLQEPAFGSINVLYCYSFVFH